MADSRHGDGSHYVEPGSAFFDVALGEARAEVVSRLLDRKAVDDRIDAGRVGPLEGAVSFPG